MTSLLLSITCLKKVVVAITWLFAEVGTCNHTSGSSIMMIEFLHQVHQHAEEARRGAKMPHEDSYYSVLCQSLT